MNTKHNIMLILLLLFLPLVSEGETYKVVIPSVPDSLSYNDFSYTQHYFILNQLHKRMFTNVTESSYETELFKTVKVHGNHKNFEFCLNPDIEFSNGRTLTVSIIKENIDFFYKKGIIKQLPKGYNATSDCLSISFADPYLDFIFDLSFERAVIADPVSFNDKFLIGLSKYKIANIVKGKKLELIAYKEKPFIDKIIFYKWTKDEKEQKEIGYKTSDIDDFNRVAFMDKDPQLQKVLSNYNRMSFLSYLVSTLIINMKDDKLRKIVWNCLDANDLRNAYLVNGIKLEGQIGLLPKNFAGSGQYDVKQNCKYQKLRKIHKLILLSFRKEFVAALKDAVIKSKLKSLNIDVDVRYADESEIINKFKTQNYDLIFITFIIDHINYIKNFDIHSSSQEESITQVKNKIVDKYLNLYSNNLPYETRMEYLSLVDRSVVDNAQLLVQGQVYRDYYFPRKFKLKENFVINSDYKIENIVRADK
ncbi:MAG: hypothetical protein HQK50_01185 [Oligoflexia bacterium]|nr:hypothetical protein [Oligoflexia bacterium]